MGIDNTPREVSVNSQECIGPVLLGLTNPVGLSRDSFSQSPDLLYHGSSVEFEFSRGFDYIKQPINSVHSHTVGRGFYATRDKNDAALFSSAFGSKEQPVIVEVLPYQARMYDFRTRDEKANAPVPRDLLAKYVEYVEANFEERWSTYDFDVDTAFLEAHPPDDIPDETRRSSPTSFEDYFATIPGPNSTIRLPVIERLDQYIAANNYLKVLQTKFASGNPIDLREMLSIKGEATASEYASQHIHDFMLAEGFDGVVYIEGGDHPEQVNPVSIVFYNLDRIGTYETWNPKAE